MSERPFTPEEKEGIAAVCKAFAGENKVQVKHYYDKPSSVWLSVSDGNRSVTSGTYTAEIDRAPSFVTARLATYLTLSRMWRK